MKEFTAVDYASKNGDYTCKLHGHIDKDGTMIVDKIDFIEKEVIKKMAIDYKKEWEELLSKHGSWGVNVPHEAVSVTLHSIMDAQIDDTINDREKLMEKYIKAQIRTDIIGADRGYHKVKIEVFGESRGCVDISKSAFKAWCKKKGGK